MTGMRPILPTQRLTADMQQTRELEGNNSIEIAKTRTLTTSGRWKDFEVGNIQG
jgi:hypothetical protein